MGETYRISVDIDARDQSGQVLASARANVTALEQGLSRTRQQMSQMSNQRYNVQVGLTDRASAGLRSVANLATSVARSPYTITVGVKNQVTGVLRGIQRDLQTLTTLPAMILEAAGFESLVNFPLRLANNMTRATIGMETLFRSQGKSAQEAQAFNQQLIQMTERSATLNYETVSAGTRRLIGGGMAPEKAGQTVQALGNIGAAMGMTESQTNRAFTAIEHMFATGHVQAMQLRSLAMANIPVYHMLAEGFSEVAGKTVTVADVQKGMREGIIDSGKAIDILIKQFNKLGNTGQEELLKTFPGAMNALNNFIQNELIVSWGQGIADALNPVIHGLFSFFNDPNNRQQVTEWKVMLHDLSFTMVHDFATGLQTVAKWLYPIISSQEFKNAPSLFDKLGVVGRHAFLDITNQLGPFGKALQWLIDVGWPNLYHWGKMALSTITDWAGKANKAVENLVNSPAWQNADSLWGKVVVAWTQLVYDPFTAWWNTNKQTVLRNVSGIGTTVGAALKTALLAAFGMIQKLGGGGPDDPLGGAGAADNSMVDAGTQIGLSFWKGFTDAFDADTVYDAMTKALGAAIPRLLTWFRNIQPTWLGGQSTGLGAVAALGLDVVVFRTLAGLLSTLLGPIGTLVGAVGTARLALGMVGGPGGGTTRAATATAGAMTHAERVQAAEGSAVLAEEAAMGGLRNVYGARSGLSSAQAAEEQARLRYEAQRTRVGRAGGLARAQPQTAADFASAEAAYEQSRFRTAQQEAELQAAEGAYSNLGGRAIVERANAQQLASMTRLDRILGGAGRMGGSALRGTGRFLRPGIPGALLAAGFGIADVIGAAPEDRRAAGFHAGGETAGALIGGGIGAFLGGPVGAMIGGIIGQQLGGIIGDALAKVDWDHALENLRGVLSKAFVSAKDSLADFFLDFDKKSILFAGNFGYTMGQWFAKLGIAINKVDTDMTSWLKNDMPTAIGNFVSTAGDKLGSFFTNIGNALDDMDDRLHGRPPRHGGVGGIGGGDQPGFFQPAPGSPLDNIGRTVGGAVQAISSGAKQGYSLEMAKQAFQSYGPVQNSDVGSFYGSLAPYAQRVQEATGIPASVLLGMAANETGYGSSTLATGANNLFSIKGTGPAGSMHFGSVWEVINGQNVQVPADFRKYNNPGESFIDFAELMRNPRYKDVWNHLDDPTAFVEAMRAAGYATDPNYTSKISNIMNNAELKKALGFQNEGWFRAGGSGGPDSQMFPLRMSPGEIAEIHHGPPQSGSGANITFANGSIQINLAVDNLNPNQVNNLAERVSDAVANKIASVVEHMSQNIGTYNVNSAQSPKGV